MSKSMKHGEGAPTEALPAPGSQGKSVLREDCGGVVADEHDTLRLVDAAMESHLACARNREEDLSLALGAYRASVAAGLG